MDDPIYVVYYTETSGVQRWYMTTHIMKEIVTSTAWLLGIDTIAEVTIRRVEVDKGILLHHTGGINNG